MTIKLSIPQTDRFTKNQHFQPQDIGYTIISLSISNRLLTLIDQHCKNTISRSHYISTILNQHLNILNEKDPRFLLQKAEQELSNLETYYQQEKAKLVAEKDNLHKIVEEKNKEMINQK